VKNFAMHWKLVFVAAVTLTLAAALGLSALALAQPAHGVPANVALPASSIFAPPLARPDGLDQERHLSPGPIIGLICAIVASSVALGVAFGLRRRIDQIAGSDPDKADDD